MSVVRSRMTKGPHYCIVRRYCHMEFHISLARSATIDTRTAFKNNTVLICQYLFICIFNNVTELLYCISDHLKIHMKTHDNRKPFQCTECNRGYNTAAALTSHMQNHKKSSDTPSPTPGTTFKCLQCADVFRKPEDLQVRTNIFIT